MNIETLHIYSTANLKSSMNLHLWAENTHKDTEAWQTWQTGSSQHPNQNPSCLQWSWRSCKNRILLNLWKHCKGNNCTCTSGVSGLYTWTLTPDETYAEQEEDHHDYRNEATKKREESWTEKRNKLMRILWAVLPSAVYPADRVKQKSFITPPHTRQYHGGPALQTSTQALYQRAARLNQTHRLLLLTAFTPLATESPYWI